MEISYLLDHGLKGKAGQIVLDRVGLDAVELVVNLDLLRLFVGDTGDKGQRRLSQFLPANSTAGLVDVDIRLGRNRRVMGNEVVTGLLLRNRREAGEVAHVMERTGDLVIGGNLDVRLKIGRYQPEAILFRIGLDQRSCWLYAFGTDSIAMAE